MDLLAAFQTFVRIAETGSFSAVAREVGTTQPAVSRQIAALETHLGARLLQRSTRSLRLTEDGAVLLDHARQVLEIVAATEAALGRQRDAPSGTVRLGAPTVFGRLYLAPRLGPLLDRHPALEMDLVMSDDVADMVQAGLDLAIRVGPVTDGSLVARRVGSTAVRCYAAPAYIEAHGTPQAPGDLTRHVCLVFTRTPDPMHWVFRGDQGEQPVQIAGRLRANSIEAIHAAALAGLGVALLPGWLADEDAREGRLTRVLAAWEPARRPISLVYPSRRFLAPRTRAVIDFLVEEFRLDPTISSYGEV